MIDKSATGSVNSDRLVRPNRGPVQSVPIWLTLEALVQDNGDGTWSATVPALTRGVETGPSKEIVLHRLKQALSWQGAKTNAQT